MQVRELETKLQSLEQSAKLKNKIEEDKGRAGATSYNERKKENKEDEQKIKLVEKTKMVGETVIPNGELLEVEQAPAGTGCDWNAQDDDKSSGDSLYSVNGK